MFDASMILGEDLVKKLLDLGV